MAKITPVAYNFSGNPQIPDTTQIGNLSIGNTPQDECQTVVNNFIIRVKESQGF